MTNTIWNTQINTATLRIGVDRPHPDVFRGYAWFQFNFQITKNSKPTGTSDDWNNDVATWTRPIFEPLMPIGSFPTLYWTINTQSIPHLWTNSSAIMYPTVPNDQFLPWPNGICATLRTQTKTRHAIGRMHWPYLRAGDLHGSRFTDAGRTRLAGLAAFMKTTKVIRGVSLTPCVWSRALSTSYSTTSVTWCANTTWRQKRRPLTHTGPYLPIYVAPGWPHP